LAVVPVGPGEPADRSVGDGEVGDRRGLAPDGLLRLRRDAEPEAGRAGEQPVLLLGDGDMA
jgi:hypothetical protein